MKYLYTFALIGMAAWAHAQPIPFEFSGGRIVVNASMANADALAFLLDSALPAPVIDLDLAGQLQLTLDENSAVDMPGPDGLFVRAVPCELPKVFVSGAAFGPTMSVAMDLKPFTDKLGRPVDGIVNFTALAPIVTVNFQRSELYMNLEFPSNLQAIPLRKAADGSWMASVTIDDAVATDAAIDFSMSGTIAIPEEFASNRGIITGDTPLLSTGPDVGRVRLQRLRLGGAVIESPICDLTATGAHPRIGLGFLKHWPVTFDTANARMGIEVDELERIDAPLVGVGVALVRQRPGGWEVAVAEGTSAEAANVTTGDVLTAVNGEFIGGFTLDAARKALELTQGQSAECRFERAESGSVYKVTLTAEELL